MNSIAVLPFANLSPESQNEYLADGITEEIISSLAKIGDLKVISRTSAFQFKGQQVVGREVGHRLGVAHFLEGSLRKVGENLRVSAQLIRASDDVLLWSKRFDRVMGDIFEIQDEIAGAIVDVLSNSLAVSSDVLKQGEHNESVEAYQSYLLGLFHWNRRTEENTRLAIAAFNRALEVKPDYALAHAGLSLAYRLLFSQGYESTEENIELALHHAQRALELNEGVAEAHISEAMIMREHEWDWARAEHHCLRALELKPGYALAHGVYSEYLRCVGRFDEALHARLRAIELDPLNVNNYTSLCLLLFFMGDHKGGMRAAKEVLELDANFPFAHYFMGLFELGMKKPECAIEQFQRETTEWRRRYGTTLALIQLGEQHRAREELQRFIGDYGDAGAYQIGALHIQLGDLDSGFKWLNTSMAKRDGGIADAKYDPLLRPAQDDPRMKALIRKLGLVE